MKVPSVEKWIPNLFLILLFEDGRKQGLGLWIVAMGFFLFIFRVNGFDLLALEAFIGGGATIFAGGNLADKWMNVKAGKAPDAPAA